MIGTKKSSIGICGCRLAVDCGRVGKNTSDRITGKLSASFLRPHSESLEKAKRVKAIQVMYAVMVSKCISNPVNFFTLQLRYQTTALCWLRGRLPTTTTTITTRTAQSTVVMIF